MLGNPSPLPVWDRQAGKLVEEFMDDHPATYDSRPRRSPTQWLESQPLYDWLMAAYQNTRYSARNIEPFIRKHHIDMSEFKPVAYRSFARILRPRIPVGTAELSDGGRGNGRIRGSALFRLGELRERSAIPDQKTFAKRGGHSRQSTSGRGPLWVARSSSRACRRWIITMCITPITGRRLEKDHLGWRLWTVNWHALQNQSDILFRNERQINILETRNFGRFAFVEIGAMSVGRIVQVHPLDQLFERGAEKSVFKFGGSAVIMFGEAEAWSPSSDILQQTRQGVETLVRLGDRIASRS